MDQRMSSRVRVERFEDLAGLPASFAEFGSCEECIYWEDPEAFEKGVRDAALKGRWVSRVLREFGNCGLRASVDRHVVGCIQYAPPRFYGRRLGDYASGPPSDEAVLISCLYIRDKAQRGKGIASKLLHTALDELKARGYDKVEAFPRIGNDDNPSGPLGLYVKHGFRIVHQRDEFPLVRSE